MTRFAGFILHSASGSVVRVLNAAARRDSCPEVVEHVTVRVPSFAGCQSNLPNPDPGVLTEQARAHMSILRVDAELFDELVGPAGEAGADQFAGQGQINAVRTG